MTVNRYGIAAIRRGFAYGILVILGIMSVLAENIRQTFASVPTMDDTAVDEAFPAQRVLHDDVVTMGVNAYVLMPLTGKLHGQLHDAFHLSTACYPVDGGVRQVIQPCPVNDFICRIFAFTQDKRSYNIPFLQAHIAVSAFDVAHKQFFAWVILFPLFGIAGRGHEFSCRSEDFQEARDICWG